MKCCILDLITISLILVSLVMVNSVLPAINGVAFALVIENDKQLFDIENKTENSLPCHHNISKQKASIQKASRQKTSVQNVVVSMDTSHDCCADESVKMNQYCEHDHCNDCNSNASSPIALLTHYLKSDFANGGNIQTNSKQIPVNPYEPVIVPPIA